jgi:hypothetical protein
MTRLVDISLYEKPALYGDLVAVPPQVNGIADTDGFRTSTDAAGGTGGRAVYNTSTTVRGGTRTPTFLRIIDGGIIAPTHPWVEVWPGQQAIQKKSPAYTQWSMRALIRSPSPTTSANQNNQKLLAFYSGGTESFGIRRDANASAPTQRVGIVATSGGTSNIVGGNMGTTPHRIEIQVDSTATPKVVVRLYADDGTTLLQAPITASPTTVTMDAIRFGDLGSTTGLSSDWMIAELEVWDTRNADGAMSNQWDSATGGVAHASNTGAQRTTFTTSVPAGYTTPADAPTQPSISSWGSLGFRDSAGSSASQMNLRIPNGAPRNSTGFPLIVWLHGGFGFVGAFDANSASGLPSSIRDRFLAAGFAVASVDYVLSVVTGASYPAYNTSPNVGGRHPSHICNAKLAIQRLIDVHSRTGSSPKTNNVGAGFDPNRIIVAGASFGGYLAGAVALSRGVTDDGYGGNLTLAGNPSYAVTETGSTYSGPDPVVVGFLSLHGPVGFAEARNYDRSHNQYGATLNAPFTTYGTITQSSVGWVWSASRGYFGRVFTSDPTADQLAAMSLLNLAPRCATASTLRAAVQVGPSDILVPPAAASLSSVASSFRTYNEFTSPANHDNCAYVYDWDNRLKPWLQEVGGIKERWKPKAVMAAV